MSLLSSESLFNLGGALCACVFVPGNSIHPRPLSCPRHLDASQTVLKTALFCLLDYLVVLSSNDDDVAGPNQCIDDVSKSPVMEEEFNVWMEGQRRAK